MVEWKQGKSMHQSRGSFLSSEWNPVPAKHKDHIDGLKIELQH